MNSVNGMNSIIIVIIVIAVFMVIVSALIVFIALMRVKRTFGILEDMADRAGAGEDILEIYDESRLSALETKYAHFLSASAVSARNVKAEKDKIKTLISDISHQTKTPIANLILYSDLLAEEELPSSARENVTAIQKQAEKLRFLIDALVKLSRLENGILRLHPKKEAVEPMLREVYEAYKGRAADKGLELIWEAGGTEARMAEARMAEARMTEAQGAVFDAKWTSEAVANLVENAIKYTRQGSVRISVSAYEMFLRIDIKDSGIGIPEEEQAKIFARFYRAQAVQGEEGVGVGLYLAREILAGEGGYIKVTSRLGEGSVFSVFLPRE